MSAHLAKPLRCVIFMANLLTSVVGMFNVALAAELIWSDDSGIHRLGIEPTHDQLVQITYDNSHVGLAIDVATRTMYWSDVLPLGAPGPAGFIFGDRLSGGSRTTLVSNLNAPGAVAYDSPNKSIYWTDTTATLWQPDSIYVWAGEGASGKRILSDITISQIGGIAIDEVHQQIYFTYVNPLIDSLFPGAVARADLDGSNVQTIVSGLSQPQGIAIDPVGGEVFWADTRGAPDAGLGLIQAAALDGSGRRTVVGGLDYPVGVALDILSKDVYWTDMGTGKLQRTSMSGALPFLEDVRTNLPNPRSLVNVPEPTVAISMVLAACYVLAQRRK